MIRRLIGEWPAWAQRKNPLLRYELHRSQPEPSMRGRVMRATGLSLALIVVILMGVLYATAGFREPAGINPTEGIWRALFFPLLLVQISLSVAAFSLGVEAISVERRNQTWDHLRATEIGAEVTLRTRWVAILYRLRFWIGVLLVGRVVLVGAMLVELTSHRGGYLDLLTANITPEIALLPGVLLLAATMAASFLLVLTGVGLEVAFGLLISAFFAQRVYAAVVQVGWLTLRLLWMLALLIATTAFLQGQLSLPDGAAWALLFAYSATVDWGLALMQLSQSGEVWALVPYSVFLGAALLIWLMAQALIADWLIHLAVRMTDRGHN